ncbi:MAG: hypothetical protein AAFX45_10655 [Pseudomonadota bacterium]
MTSAPIDPFLSGPVAIAAAGLVIYLQTQCSTRAGITWFTRIFGWTALAVAAFSIVYSLWLDTVGNTSWGLDWILGVITAVTWGVAFLVAFGVGTVLKRRRPE